MIRKATSTSQKRRPLVEWHGGRDYLARKIIEHFPEHRAYVEPYGVTAAVLLNKPPSEVEIYNDLDLRIIRLFWVIGNHGEEFRRRLSMTHHYGYETDEAAKPTDDQIEMARRDYVRWKMSFGGKGKTIASTLHGVHQLMADAILGYLSSIDEQLPIIIERLITVELMVMPAVTMIEIWDGPETLIYCDPPYLHATRQKNSRDLYAYEMTEKEHIELAECLNQCESKIILSGYSSPLYEKLYGDWWKLEIDIANHAAGGKKNKRKIECLWFNYE